MQTFLPYKSFAKSAKCLDNKRLGKQRVEAMQILKILLGANPNAKWRNHPAVLQWKGYEGSLFAYLCAIANEWEDRGFNNLLIRKYIKNLNTPKSKYFIVLGNTYIKPIWLGKRKFHDSHKSMLLQKDHDWYSQFGWNVPLDLQYYWPVRKELQ